MRSPRSFAALMLTGVVLIAGVSRAGAWYAAPAAWSTWDEFGYAAPAPCKPVPIRTYWTSDYATPAPVAASCADLQLYPPLRPAAGFNPYGRSQEWNQSW